MVGLHKRASPSALWGRSLTPLVTDCDYWQLIDYLLIIKPPILRLTRYTWFKKILKLSGNPVSNWEHYLHSRVIHAYIHSTRVCQMTSFNKKSRYSLGWFSFQPIGETSLLITKADILSDTSAFLATQKNPQETWRDCLQLRLLPENWWLVRVR